jgi:hypothetical protein
LFAFFKSSSGRPVGERGVNDVAIFIECCVCHLESGAQKQTMNRSEKISTIMDKKKKKAIGRDWFLKPILYSTKMTLTRDRVTGLGDFSPIGWLFELGSFFF